MLWCPKCKRKYSEKIEVCTNCNTKLVDEIYEFEYDQEAFLMSVSGAIDAGIIESLLEANSIPVLRKHKAAGGVYMELYMGMSAAGIDLYVPLKLLKEAKDILNSELQEEVVESKDRKYEEKYIKKRRLRAWIILLFFAPGIIWLLISVIARIIQIIMRKNGYY